jgi:hypothetical protein
MSKWENWGEKQSKIGGDLHLLGGLEELVLLAKVLEGSLAGRLAGAVRSGDGERVPGRRGRGAEAKP